MSENTEKAPEQAAKPAPKKGMTRGRIVTAVVVAVIIVAGCGMFAWHNSPSFCGTVCHTPMSKYVADFEAGLVDGGSTAMLAAYHGADADMNCLSCHEPVITEQVGEVMKWTSDDYPMTADGTKLADGADMASEEFCAKSGCHDMDDVVASTWGFEGNGEQFNPHSSHQDLALECGDCHKAHEKSVLMCNQCHKLNMPEGWEAPNAA